MATLGEFPLGTSALGQAPEVSVDDVLLSNVSVLFTDELTNDLLISDVHLASANVIHVDDFVRLVEDILLSDADTLHVDSLNLITNFDPYWRWRVVRQSGNLYLIPAKSAVGWTGADVVSDDFRYNSAALHYIQNAMVTAWATHSGSDTATLKAAINSALGDAGVKDMEGNILT